MPKIPRIAKFDEDGLRTINEMGNAFNSGLSNEDIRADAGIPLSKLKMQVVKARTITTGTTAIRHDLGSVPVFAVAVPTSNVTVFRRRAHDSKFVYFGASSQAIADILIVG